ncbi:XRE family transcriptional regulator [Methylobacterium indicum]|nr:XRE family transcriptional regulator [Methylobacterium indicum]
MPTKLPIVGKSVKRKSCPHRATTDHGHSAIVPPMGKKPKPKHALRALREARGWTQDQAAEAFGLSRDGYIKIEHGSRGISLDRMKVAAALYNVPLDVVMGETPAREPASTKNRKAVGTHDFAAHFSRDQTARITEALSETKERLPLVSLGMGSGKTRGLAALIAQRILERSNELGLDLDDIEARIEKPKSIRFFFERLNTADDQKIDISLLNAIAKPLHTTAAWLLTGIGRETPGLPAETASGPPKLDGPSGDEVAPSESRLVEAAYGGIVEAGTFREVDEFSDVAPPRAAAIADPEYPYARMVIFEVRGDSMNAYDPPITSKTQITGLDFESLGNRVPMFPGMVVVIERTRDGGHLRELSVKQLEIFEDRYEFHPRSTNPKHKPIVVPHDMGPEDGQSVRLLAWVRQVTQKI